MSELSRPASYAKPSTAVANLLAFLGYLSSAVSPDWLDELLVAYDDRTLVYLLKPRNLPPQPRLYGETIAEHLFRDVDGGTIIANLITDQNGYPFELDLWKGEGGDVIRLPELPAHIERRDLTPGELEIRRQNQPRHALRYVEMIGLDRQAVQAAVWSHLAAIEAIVEPEARLDATVIVGNHKLKYTAYRLAEGTFNVGRVLPLS
jgi:hypothetical protein